MQPPLAMSHPYSQPRTGHATQEYRVTRLDLDGRKAGLKALRSVADETRLLDGRYPPPRHDTQQQHQLTTIAGTEHERVGASQECLELVTQPSIKPERSSPAFTGIERVGVRKTAGQREAMKLIQADLAAH